jgi:hypothetical protein
MEAHKRRAIAEGWYVDDEDFVPDDVILPGDFQEEEEDNTAERR